MKRKLLVIMAGLCLAICSYAQNLAINSTGATPHPNAILDIQSSDKGVLIPRMSTAARMRIPATKGLLVYDTSSNMFW